MNYGLRPTARLFVHAPDLDWLTLTWSQCEGSESHVGDIGGSCVGDDLAFNGSGGWPSGEDAGDVGRRLKESDKEDRESLGTTKLSETLEVRGACL